MFSVCRSVGGWYRDGKRITDSEAAAILHAETEQFLTAVKKHLQLECCTCGKWGRLGSDVHVLHTGGKPVCGSPDCLSNRLMDDYSSDDVIALAILGRHHKLDDKSWNAVTSIEPTIRHVRQLMDRLEVYHGCERNDPRIRRHFAKDFAELDAAAEQVNA